MRRNKVWWGEIKGTGKPLSLYYDVCSRCTKPSSSFDFASSDNTLLDLDLDALMDSVWSDELLSNRLRSKMLIRGSFSISSFFLTRNSASLQPGRIAMSFLRLARLLSTASIRCLNWWNKISARCKVSSNWIVKARSLMYYSGGSSELRIPHTAHTQKNLSCTLLTLRISSKCFKWSIMTFRCWSRIARATNKWNCVDRWSVKSTSQSDKMSSQENSRLNHTRSHRKQKKRLKLSVFSKCL